MNNIFMMSRYKEDEDGYLRLNMVRFETVEVTEELIKNMAEKRTPRKLSGSSAQTKRLAQQSENMTDVATSSTYPSSSSSSSSSSMTVLLNDDDNTVKDRAPVYCILSTVTEMSGEHENTADSGMESGAVRVLAAVARGLGMDVV